jgi:hypothetical protein
LKSLAIAINVLYMTSLEKRVSREEAQHLAKVHLVVDSLASARVVLLVAEVPISRLPQVRADLGVEEVPHSHPQILKRFLSKSK